MEHLQAIGSAKGILNRIKTDPIFASYLNTSFVSFISISHKFIAISPIHFPHYHKTLLGKVMYYYVFFKMNYEIHEQSNFSLQVLVLAVLYLSNTIVCRMFESRFYRHPPIWASSYFSFFQTPRFRLFFDNLAPIKHRNKLMKILTLRRLQNNAAFATLIT